VVETKQVLQIITNYLQALERGDYEAIIAVFENDGVVHSPIYGTRQASDFYAELFRDTSASEIAILNTFINLHDTSTGAGHFRYNWKLKSGVVTTFECVDVFYFNANGKIKEMSIIYDTFPGCVNQSE